MSERENEILEKIIENVSNKANRIKKRHVNLNDIENIFCKQKKLGGNFWNI